MKLGELVGLATRDATLEALRWQNGLEASYTRGRVSRARPIRRQGGDAVRGHRAAARASRSGSAEKERKAAFYEPLVGAAAHALATVCDRVRYGTIPDRRGRRCDGAAGRDAGRQSRRAGPSLGRVPLDPAAACEWRREDARAQGRRARLVRKVADRVIALLGRWRRIRCCWRSAVAADLAVGDPVYRVASGASDRPDADVAGSSDCARVGLDGYGGGVLLFSRWRSSALGVVTVAALARRRARRPGWLVHVFLLYSLLALGDLLHHVWRIERAVRAGDLPARAAAVSALVGRDTDRMDARPAGARRSKASART